MITLSLENQTARIDAGELVSFQKEGHEYIHQKGSPGWRSSDTEMFPIIGPTNETDFMVQVPKGNAIQDQHGLLREMDYEVVSKNETLVLFQKTYKAGTLVKNSKFPEKSNKQWLIWPFSFVFQKQYELKADGLEITFVVSGERDMPFMLGYHPAFKLHTNAPIIKAEEKEIPLDAVIEVGDRAYKISDCEAVVLKDEKELEITTKGFGNFMLWSPEANMICIEPITFYPYDVAQRDLCQGFQYLSADKEIFTVYMKPVSN
ncbi:MAG: aldose epimerase [Flavobacteriaceae bacterium]|nr:MAG: aldose epimerase [Flavobacteriaceae bacterium]